MCAGFFCSTGRAKATLVSRQSIFREDLGILRILVNPTLFPGNFTPVLKRQPSNSKRILAVFCLELIVPPALDSTNFVPQIFLLIEQFEGLLF